MNIEGSFKVLGFFVVFVAFAAIYRRRDAIRHWIARLVGVLLVYVVAVYIAAQNGMPGVQPVIVGLVVAFAFIGLFPERKRSRYIPAAEKRKAIAGHARLTGKKFRKGKDELDHDIPFAEGGNNTADNLRVRSRKENRRNGAKSPWWDPFGRR